MIQNSNQCRPQSTNKYRDMTVPARWLIMEVAMLLPFFFPQVPPPPPLHPLVTYPSLRRPNFCVLVYIFEWGGYIFEVGRQARGRCKTQLRHYMIRQISFSQAYPTAGDTETSYFSICSVLTTIDILDQDRLCTLNVHNRTP